MTLLNLVSDNCQTENNLLKSPHDQSDNSLDTYPTFLNLFVSYIESWKKFFINCEYTCILFGVSHNSDRFLQLTSSQSFFSAIFDDTPTKAGCYLAFSGISITSYDTQLVSSKPLCFILGMHPRHHDAVKKHIF